MIQKDHCSSYLWFKNMWKYKEIDQFQIIQQDVKEYLLKINVENHFEKEAQIINEYKDILGEDAIINVSYVRDIPLLDSGKRKTTVNLLRELVRDQWNLKYPSWHLRKVL